MARRPSRPIRPRPLRPGIATYAPDDDYEPPPLPGDEGKVYLALAIDDETIITDDREVTAVFIGEDR